MARKKKIHDSDESEVDIYKFNPDFNKVTIDLIDFNKKNIKEQINIIEDTLKNIYNGTFRISKRYVDKCISLTYDPKDNVTTYLPYGLMVEKRKDELIFKYNKKFSSKLAFALIILFLFAAVAATYSAIDFLSKASLNKDINGDGVPDINLDLDGDEIADINIDINSDNKPEINIDYKGNRKSVFAIDTDKDGKADSNLLNQDTDKDGTCDLNCDLDKDGWPDINLDIDGDGKADLDIDTDGDKIPDMNLDVDGDSECDLYCDTDGDLKCDKFCTKNERQKNDNGTLKDNITSSSRASSSEKPKIIVKNPTKTETGNPRTETVTPELVVVYSDSNEVNATGLYPDDQGFDSSVPDKEFTLENKSTIPIRYRISWEVITNNFVSENFQYRVRSTNGGANIGYTTAPKYNTTFIRSATVPALTTQKYTIKFRLRGINAEQNYDQNRTFTGRIIVEVLR